ncbi:hypothetical protein K439DRAFT_1356587 [Ramaria rubella]|nr:hypothetical protein K439DRAFT_1356587 [Ramaria rubella]
MQSPQPSKVIFDDFFHRGPLKLTILFLSQTPKAYKCIKPGCTSSFARMSDLSRHNLTHTQLKPFKCQWPGCGKGFNQKGQLSDFCVLSTGEKPHECPNCSKTFSDPASRTRHRKEAHGPKDLTTHQCPVCGSRYVDSSNDICIC